MIISFTLAILNSRQTHFHNQTALSFINVLKARYKHTTKIIIPLNKTAINCDINIKLDKFHFMYIKETLIRKNILLQIYLFIYFFFIESSLL